MTEISQTTLKYTHLIGNLLLFVSNPIDFFQCTTNQYWPKPKSAMVEIMVCRLFGAEPLYKPMMGHCQLDPQEQSSVQF